MSELAAEYGVHPTMKRSLLEGAAGIFERGGGKAAAATEVAEETVRELHAKIVG